MTTHPLFVLSPCGTSLLTNHATDNDRKLIGKYANTKEPDDIQYQDLKTLQNLTQTVRENLKDANFKQAAKLSAELNGIIKLCEGQFNTSQDYHLLLCTDTWLGHTTAIIVSDWLRNQGVSTEIKRQSDLQTKDLTAFQLALSDLVSWCAAMLPSYRNRGYHIVFNLTGGFKSVQGFLQTLSTFYADESIYIFETATDLLRIPRLPVEMAAENTVRQNFLTFRKLSLNLPVDNTAKIPETLLLKSDGMIDLSPWGDLVWEQTKDRLYREALHPSPYAKITFSSKFEQSLQGLQPDRLILLNTRIDQLVKFFETNKQNNPRSLDFKALKGNPCPPSTHEIDAWSDNGAYRIFAHYEGDRLILDKLDKHLP
ncbi:MAG: putative CRISPR-associated protein [Acaryochloridaceae cyanobacterium RU_4_10]|nr:putative CRISPR-associated protein [Acaryochloridaceae cyanobacterium RU_4_10]